MAKAHYPLTITAVDNGFLVQAGCMTLVFDDGTKLLSELAAWFSNPREVEEKYSNKYSLPTTPYPVGDFMGSR